MLSIFLLAAGAVLIRLLLFVLPLDSFYLPDHLNTWAWWKHSVEQGLDQQYGYGRKPYSFSFLPVIRTDQSVFGQDGLNGENAKNRSLSPVLWSSMPNNYPPMNVYIRHVLGLLHQKIDPDMQPLTPLAWMILEMPTYLADILLALALLKIISIYRGMKWGLAAYGVVLFLPPFIFTGVLFGQCDTWFLAPCVWCIYFCLQGRWRWAGLLFGFAMMMKPQAIIMAPALLYFFYQKKAFAPLAVFSGWCLAGMILLSLPFLATSSLAWLENSYLENFTVLMPYTTLNAFNFWMIDFIYNRNLDVAEVLLCFSKRNWGLILVCLGLGAGFYSVIRRYRNEKPALPLLAALSFAAVFLFSTRVHERYILYVLPFLLISAMIEKRFWIPFIGFTIISSLETSLTLWLVPGIHLSGASSGQWLTVLVLSVTGLALYVWWIAEIWTTSSPLCASEDNQQVHC